MLAKLKTMRANGFVRLCEVSLSSDQLIMLALKKFISCYAVALCIKTHSALLAAWIESNILLQLASAPFDKQDETLVPEAGSCANCPKRTGFNKLLFPDVRKDSCKLCGIRFWGWGAGEGGGSPSPAQLFRSGVGRLNHAGCFILIGLSRRRSTWQSTSSFSPSAGIVAQLWPRIQRAAHG